MKTRCNAANGPRAHIYFGKVTYCREWESFENFYKDMGDRPSGMSLDRIDGDMGYFKDNCRWADSVIQARNQHKTSTKTTSQYKGVYWSKQKQKWHARIRVGGQAIHLGFYSDEVVAAKAYDRKAAQYFGFRLNFLSEGASAPS